MSTDPAIARLLRIADRAVLHDVEESISYGTPAIKLKSKFLARLRDATTLAIRCPLAEKEMLIEAEPTFYFETPHYHGYDAILLHLDIIDDDRLQARLERAWFLQAGKRDIAKREAALAALRGAR